MNKKNIMVVIVIGAAILYVWGLLVIGSASLAATELKPAKVSELWINLVAAVTTVLAMNAGAYLGLAEKWSFRFDLKDPEAVKGVATLIYAVAIFGAFLVAARSQYPHPSLTDMGGTLAGFIAGVLTVYLGKP